MISVDGLTVEFGGTTLFSDISFQINEKDRIALMGKTVQEIHFIKDIGRRPPAYPGKSDRSERLCGCLPSAAFDDGRRAYRV